MSVTEEKYRAICRAGFFLTKIMYQKDRGLSQEARQILRHFPGIYELEEIFNGRETLRPGSHWESMAREREIFLNELDAQLKEFEKKDLGKDIRRSKSAVLIPKKRRSKK